MAIKNKAGEWINIQNARVHNLDHVNVDIPRDHLIVITGLSGSGKSSLAFDTLYAEGQRRYVESLSSYARQFLGRMNKPEVDHIYGIPPAIAIEQKVNSHNPRSIVGTSTEIYDYLRLLFARIGKTFSPVSGQEVKAHQVEDVVEFVSRLEEGKKVAILSPVDRGAIELDDFLKSLKQQGFRNFMCHDAFYRVDDRAFPPDVYEEERLDIVIDRLKVKEGDDAFLSRLSDSVETAFNESGGECLLWVEGGERKEKFNHRFEADGMEFEQPTEQMFSFNSPLGACPVCEGYGKVLGIDEDLVVPDKTRSVYDDAVACWRGEKTGKWKKSVVMNAGKVDFPVHRPYNQLNEEQKEMLWNGSGAFKGINHFFQHLEKKKYKIQNRVMIARYRGKSTCPECKGKRLRKEAGYVKINQTAIQDLLDLPVDQLHDFFLKIRLSDYEVKIGQRILVEINNRIQFLLNVGLGYLTLNRMSSTLSGGESQRINLASSLGSNLVGSLYVLDEPSVGLHPRDTSRLVEVLKQLREKGNTVVVVEHEEEIIRAADYIIDMGPEAGRLGGKVVYQGTGQGLLKHEGLTAEYLNGTRSIPVPDIRRKASQFIKLEGVREHNLKNINVEFPLGILTVLSGVSGSGKSTLVGDVLYPALSRKLNQEYLKSGEFDKISGDIYGVEKVEYVTQNPIGKSSRSNPVTYLKAYDDIRKLFAEQPAAKINGFKASHFSFNVPGGRCDECEGEGETTVEMQFMADVHLICERCGGKRFKDDVLEVMYRGKSIHDILELTIDEALTFFAGDSAVNNICKRIADKIFALKSVGLGYVKLGQPSSTLSGGESQRIKLASFLTLGNSAQKHFFIFDEPTVGLHFHDINHLLKAFNELIDKGHTILVIEHNPDMIKTADWVIDLGPEGGEGGGEIVFSGTPEQLSRCRDSYTSAFLDFK